MTNLRKTRRVIIPMMTTCWQRLHVLWRVIDGPGFAIDCLPLFSAHARMRGADVLDIVSIEVRVHRNAFLPENLMVLRAWQRR
jgi:hypothetical protein